MALATVCLAVHAPGSQRNLLYEALALHPRHADEGAIADHIRLDFQLHGGLTSQGTEGRSPATQFAWLRVDILSKLWPIYCKGMQRYPSFSELPGFTIPMSSTSVNHRHANFIESNRI